MGIELRRHLVEMFQFCSLLGKVGHTACCGEHTELARVGKYIIEFVFLLVVEVIVIIEVIDIDIIQSLFLFPQLGILL